MAFVNAATYSSGLVAVTSQATTLPTYSAGDVLVLAVATQGGAAQALGGLGAWTLAPNGRVDNTAAVLAVYYIKNATGGESAPTITLSLSRRIVGFIASFSGRDTTAPLATDHGTANASSTNCTEGTGITVTNASSDILFIGECTNSRTFTAPTSPGTWTEQVDLNSGAGATQNSSVTLDTSTQPTGATGAVTAVLNVASENNAYLMELIPASAGGGQPTWLRRMFGKAQGVAYPGRGI